MIATTTVINPQASSEPSEISRLDNLQYEAIMTLRQGTRRMQSNIQEMARILKAPANA